MTGKTDELQTMHLNLEKSSGTKAKRNLVVFQDCIYAYGGENGLISALGLSDVLSSTAVADATGASSPRSLPSFKVIHSFDEPVRALAFSSDGQRVAVGLDDGVIEIYEFTAEQVKESPHPFGERALLSSSNLKNVEADGILHNDNIFASQQEEDDLFATNVQESGGNEVLPSFRVPHRFDSSIRSLDFCPIVDVNAKQSYFLAIATESSPGLTIANVTSLSAFEKYLDSEASSVYEHHGVRNAVFSPDGNQVVSLGCNGMLCLWNVPVGGDRELEWELGHQDKHLVVSKQDTGSFASCKDKSVAVVWSQDGSMIAIPGEKDLQFRRNDGSNNVPKDQRKSTNVEWFARDRLVWKQDVDATHTESRSSSNKNGLGDRGGAHDYDEDNVIVGIAMDPHNEGYVVTSSYNGAIGLWKLDKDAKDDEPQGQFVGNIHHTDSFCSHMLWHKGESEALLLALENGSMQVILGRDKIVERVWKQKMDLARVDELDVEVHDTQEVEFDTQDVTSDLKLMPKEKKRLKRAAENVEASHSDEESIIFEDENNATRTWSKNQFVMDEADEVEEDGTEGNGYTEPSNGVTSRVNHDDDHPLEDNVDGGHHVDEMDQNANDQFETNEDDDDDENFEEGRDFGSSHVVPIPEPQAPFVPSSTPLAKRRILCWNQNGVITSRERQDFGSTFRTIDMTFTDSASNRPISFRDPYNFIIGTFGEEGGLFASDLMEDIDDDDIVDDDMLNGMSDATKAIVKKSRRKIGSMAERATGSNIYFHRFDTFASLGDKDWTLALPEGELVLGCATGIGWNAVVTNRRFLRMFSTSGLQGPIIWLKGDPVTLVGRGRLCAAIYHEGNPFVDGTQRLGYSLYDGVNGKLIVEGSVSAISPRSSLAWAGFNSDMSFCVMDDEGMISMLVASRIEGIVDNSYRWTPVLDTLGLKKSSEDEFWPVALQEGKFICVPLKGMKHPDPLRRPLTTSFPLRLPLARGSGGRNIGMDEICVRANLALENKKFLQDLELSANPGIGDELDIEYNQACAKVDKVTLKLYLTFMQDGKLENAYDLTQRLHLEKSLEIAMEAADRSGHARLSDRIHALREERFPILEEPEDEDQFDNLSPVGLSTAEPEMMRRISPSSITRTKRKHPEEDDDVDLQEPTSESSNNINRRLNPFAKKHKESPPKTIMESPQPKKPALSRMSTFSAESRQKSKLTKHFL